MGVSSARSVLSYSRVLFLMATAHLLLHQVNSCVTPTGCLFGFFFFNFRMRQRVHVLGQSDECRQEDKLGKVDEEDIHTQSLQLVALVALLLVLSFSLWPYATGRAPPRRIPRPLMYGLSEGNYSYLQGITCKNCASKVSSPPLLRSLWHACIWDRALHGMMPITRICSLSP